MSDAIGKEPMDFDSDTRFVRWITSPEGDLFEVRGGSLFGTNSPVWLDAEIGGATVRRVLGIINEGLVRIQRPRTEESGAFVSVLPSGGDEAVYGRNCKNLDTARQHAAEIINEIADGTLYFGEE